MNTALGLMVIAAIATIIFVAMALLVAGVYLGSSTADGESPVGYRPHANHKS